MTYLPNSNTATRLVDGELEDVFALLHDEGQEIANAQKSIDAAFFDAFVKSNRLPQDGL
jgi:hypothetical protein